MISNFDPSLDLYLLLSSTSSSPQPKIRRCLPQKLSVSILVQLTRVSSSTVLQRYCVYWWHFFQNRCVGVWQNDRVEIIANDQGNRTTPSYVSFSDNERLIGDAAKNQVAMNPHNT